MKKWNFMKYDVYAGDWGGFVAWYQGDNEMLEFVFSMLQGFTYGILIIAVTAMIVFGTVFVSKKINHTERSSAAQSSAAYENVKETQIAEQPQN